MSKRAANKQARRQRLMAEARSLYAANGVENTTMEDVARAAGCTRRTLYAYFASAADLSLNVFVDDIAERWEFQKQAMAAGKTGHERIRLWAESYYAHARAHPETVHMQMFRDYRGLDRGAVGEDVERRHREVIDPLIEAMNVEFRSGQADGSIRPGLDPMTCLSQFAFSLRALMNRVLCSDDELGDFDPDRFVNSYIDLFMRGIAPEAEVS